MSARAALITGGTSGIGKATAELLHSRGYRVAVTGQRPESVARAREELPEDVLVLRADARSLADTDRVVSEVRERFGTLTTLFLNAGVSRPVALDACDEAAFDDVFAVNTKGQFFTLVKTLPLLSDGASIIITVGIGATRSLTGNSLTAGSRGALLTMIPTLALELAPRRIRVNAVSPGFTDTPMMRTTPGMGSDEIAAMLAAMAANNPFGRVGRTEDIAETVAFLASDGAAYITGQEIVVSGGAGLTVLPNYRQSTGTFLSVLGVTDLARDQEHADQDQPQFVWPFHVPRRWRVRFPSASAISSGRDPLARRQVAAWARPPRTPLIPVVVDGVPSGPPPL